MKEKPLRSMFLAAAICFIASAVAICFIASGAALAKHGCPEFGIVISVIGLGCVAILYFVAVPKLVKGVIKWEEYRR